MKEEPCSEGTLPSIGEQESRSPGSSIAGYGTNPDNGSGSAAGPISSHAVDEMEES